MMRWAIPTILISAVFAVGGVLWWPPEEPPDRCSDLGTALMGGAVVAFAALYLEQRFSRAAENRDLRLQIGLEDSLAGIDLSCRNLSGFHLAGKDLRGANLKGANLREA